VPRSRRQGFTLIEILIALAIGGLVVLLTHSLFSAVAERVSTLLETRAALDREANARRWLAATFLSLDVGTDTAIGFDGRADRAAFSAWLLTADGWFTRRAVTLARQDGRLVATLASGEEIVLHDHVIDVAFDYLLEPGADARWVRKWVSLVSAPLAVRLRVRSRGAGARGTVEAVDTMLLLVKERE
jgi:prepilin-type N-terminal cleavage/methylation domain-containing protein